MKENTPHNQLHTFHIGMRAGKSLLAILIGFFIWQAIRLFFPDLEIHPVFIYIYGFLEIRETAEKTKTLGLQRIKATLVAMAVALPMLLLRVFCHASIGSLTLVTAIDLIMILVGSLVTLLLGQRAKCGSMTGLSAVIFIILLIYHADDARYLYALLRASQTVIGVGVAWLLNVVLFPYPGRKNEEKS